MERLRKHEGWTLERLRDAVVRPARLRTCSGPALHGLLAAAVEAVGPGPFGSQARSATFLQSLEGALEELAHGSVSAATLEEAAARLGSAGARLAHLARLIDAATTHLNRAGVELAASRWVAASSVLVPGWPAHLPVQQVELTVAPPLSPGMVGVLSALARAASSSGRAPGL